MLGAVIIAAVLVAPRIAQTRRDNAASERRERQQAVRAARARIVERQRPRTVYPGRGTNRAALVRAIPAAVRRDSDARRGATPVRRVECQPVPGSARASFACTAVTSSVANVGLSGRGVIGYPYRVAVDERRGTITMCQVAGQAAEGSFVRNARVPLSPRCG